MVNSSVEENIEKHPSYGLIRFNRVTGSPKALFGTNLVPNGFIEMTITKGERHTGHGWTNYYGHDEIISVWLSAAQFAEVITTMNMGCGVPCTIKHVQGNRITEPPTQKTEAEIVHQHFKERMAQFEKEIKDFSKDISRILNKEGSISKKDRKDLMLVFERALQEVGSNIPYYLKVYDEAAKDLVTTAKTEFDAFVTSAAALIGLDQIRNSGIDKLQLAGREKEDENLVP